MHIGKIIIIKRKEKKFQTSLDLFLLIEFPFVVFLSVLAICLAAAAAAAFLILCGALFLLFCIIDVQACREKNAHDLFMRILCSSFLLP